MCCTALRCGGGAARSARGVGRAAPGSEPGQPGGGTAGAAVPWTLYGHSLVEQRPLLAVHRRDLGPGAKGGVHADGGAPLRIVYPKDGISISADAMALIAKAPNPAAGKALIDYIVSAEGQSVIVKASGRRPIRTDVPGPEKAAPAESLPVKTYPPEWAVANQKRFMDRYLRLARR